MRHWEADNKRGRQTGEDEEEEEDEGEDAEGAEDWSRMRDES